MSEYNKNKFKIKLDKLKELRLQKMEKQLLDDTLKGYDHYVFINERGKAQVITNGKWVTEFIRTAVVKHNALVCEVLCMREEDFSEQELKDFEDGLLS